MVSADSRQANIDSATVEFTIPGDPIADLSPNRRLHVYARNRLTQEWRTRSWIFWDQAGRGRLPGKVRLTFTFRRGREADADNALASCKALIDGLTDLPGRPAMLPSDGPHDVEYGPVRFETGGAWKHRPEVVVRVEAVAC